MSLAQPPGQSSKRLGGLSQMAVFFSQISCLLPQLVDLRLTVGDLA